MNLVEQIASTAGVDLGQVGSGVGLDPAQTKAAMSSLLPAVVGGFQKKADNDGTAPLIDATRQTGLPDTSTGNAILGHIFGNNKDVSRQVADHAASQNGLPSAAMKALLPIAATMVARHFASDPSGAQGALGSLAARLSQAGAPSASSGSLGQILSAIR